MQHTACVYEQHLCTCTRTHLQLILLEQYAPPPCHHPHHRQRRHHHHAHRHRPRNDDLGKALAAAAMAVACCCSCCRRATAAGGGCGHTTGSGWRRELAVRCAATAIRAAARQSRTQAATAAGRGVGLDTEVIQGHLVRGLEGGCSSDGVGCSSRHAQAGGVISRQLLQACNSLCLQGAVQHTREAATAAAATATAATFRYRNVQACTAGAAASSSCQACGAAVTRTCCGQNPPPPPTATVATVATAAVARKCAGCSGSTKPRKPQKVLRHPQQRLMLRRLRARVVVDATAAIARRQQELKPLHGQVNCYSLHVSRAGEERFQGVCQVSRRTPAGCVAAATATASCSAVAATAISSCRSPSQH